MIYSRPTEQICESWNCKKKIILNLHNFNTFFIINYVFQRVAALHDFFIMMHKQIRDVTHVSCDM